MACTDTQKLPIYLTNWSRILLEKLIITQCVKKFPAFGSPRFMIHYQTYTTTLYSELTVYMNL